MQQIIQLGVDRVVTNYRTAQTAAQFPCVSCSAVVNRGSISTGIPSSRARAFCTSGEQPPAGKEARRLRHSSLGLECQESSLVSASTPSPIFPRSTENVPSLSILSAVIEQEVKLQRHPRHELH